jgi:MFS family permease
MLTQAAAIAAVAMATSFAVWAFATATLGLGTAMVYPTLLAAIGDVAHPSWRASAVGVYRLWRDSGFAVGALVAGIIADTISLDAAIWTVAALTAGSAHVRDAPTRQPSSEGRRGQRGRTGTPVSFDTRDAKAAPDTSHG